MVAKKTKNFTFFRFKKYDDFQTHVSLSVIYKINELELGLKPYSVDSPDFALTENHIYGSLRFLMQKKSIANS